MSKLVQRLAAMVAMTAVVLGATIGGVSSMMIHYKPLNEGAETVLTVNGDAVTADEYSGYMLYNMQYYASMYAQMGLTDLTRIKCVGIIDGDALTGREPKAGSQILYSCGSSRRDDDFFDVYPVFCSAGATIEVERCTV